MSSAVCHRCGGAKPGPLDPCSDCGFAPTGQDRAIAWLFSDAWLNEEERAEATQRVLAGERPDPSRALLKEARRALGGDAHGAQGAPLSRGQIALLLAANVLLTPMAGLAVWLGTRAERPRAARQAIWMTAPVAALGALAWLLMLGSQLS